MRSAMAGVVWPAFPTARAAHLLALQWQLARSEWLSEAAVEAQQLRQLSGLVEHAFRHVPYYGQALRDAGYAAGRPVTRELWDRLPVLERAEVQQHAAHLHSDSVPQDHGSVSEVVTSGSTGMPVKVRRTDLSLLLWEAITLRDHAWHERDFDATLAGVRWYPDGVAAYPDGASWPDWGPPAAEICATAPSFGLSVTASAGEQAEWLSRIQPEYLVVFPSLLPQLARECAAQGVRLDRLRQIRTVGECLPAGLRDLCAQQWGVPVRDVYSAHEVGYIALQCPLHDHYHAQSESILVEVLDAQGRACRPGEIGRVVVTPLHNYAMPLLRYALGDYAEAGAPCACGRGLRVLSRILGRSRNMLTLPDGRRLWPRLSELKYGDVLAVTQFQVIQKDATRLEVRLVAARAGTPEEERRLRAIIVERIGYPFEVVFSYPGHIARSAGGKFEDFRSEVSAA